MGVATGDGAQYWVPWSQNRFWAHWSAGNKFRGGACGPGRIIGTHQVPIFLLLRGRGDNGLNPFAPLPRALHHLLPSHWAGSWWQRLLGPWGKGERILSHPPSPLSPWSLEAVGSAGSRQHDNPPPFCAPPAVFRPLSWVGTEQWVGKAMELLYVCGFLCFLPYT